MEIGNKESFELVVSRNWLTYGATILVIIVILVVLVFSGLIALGG